MASLKRNTCDVVSYTLLNNIEQHVEIHHGRQLILKMSFYATSVSITVSPKLSLPVLVLIKPPSPLFFPVGETFIFQWQKHCLYQLNHIQLDKTSYSTQCYLKPVSSKKQLY